MKIRFLVSCFTLFLGLNVNAQVVITDADAPKAGNSFKYSSITTAFPNFELSKKGANQVWDYSGLKNGASSTSTFSSPTPQDLKDFPDANMVQFNGIQYQYFKSSSNSIVLLGLKDTIVKKLTPPLLYSNFPVSIGSTLQGTSEVVVKIANTGNIKDLPVTVADSLMITVTITKHDTADSWGHVKTPMGMYDALRVVTHTQTKNKIEAKIKSSAPFAILLLLGSGWQNVTIYAPKDLTDIKFTRQFNWWAKGVGAQVFQINLAGETGNNINSVSWLDNSISATTNSIPENNVVFAPNPVSETAHIIINESGNYSYELINMTGTIVLSEKLNQGQNQIQFTEINKGLYLLKIMDESGRTLVKKIEVQK